MFRNQILSDQIIKKGFAILETGLGKEIDSLRDYLSNNFTLPSSEFYYSLISNDFDQNKIIQNSIDTTFKPFYEMHFNGYKIINESFLSKPPHTRAELLLHQDWCYTNERKYLAYNIWIPLTDVSIKNGAMFFLPGSQFWFENLRSGTMHSARIGSASFAHQLETVIVKKGEAIIFHPAVFHGSYPNLSSENRIIATATILDKEAPFLYYQKHGNTDEVSIFLLNENEYLKNLKFMAVGGDPSSDKSEIKSIKYAHIIPTEEDLLEKLSARNQDQ